MLPKAWGDWALKEKPSWSAAHVRHVAEKFSDYWRAQPGRDGIRADWEAVWRNWVRREPDPKPGQSGAAGDAGKPWFMSSTAIDAKGAELHVERIEGELWVAWRDRVYVAAGVTPEMVRKAKIDAGERV